MKDSDYIYVAAWLYQVGNAVVVVQENANLSGLFRFVSLPESGMVTE